MIIINALYELIILFLYLYIDFYKFIFLNMRWRQKVMGNNEVLTAEEAAEFLKLTPFTVRDYARRGILPCRKVGKAWRFYKPDLVAWLRDYEAPP
jgi:excisionase family DNA binding protein